jgi:hypothetical protein
MIKKDNIDIDRISIDCNSEHAKRDVQKKDQKNDFG